jgi:subtilisin family serine protease/subtilisin-like proprotein convertase family protein
MILLTPFLIFLFFFISACAPSASPPQSPTANTQNVKLLQAKSNFKFFLPPSVVLRSWNPSSNYSNWTAYNLPSWLQFDTSNGDLLGVSPAEGRFENIYLTYKENETNERSEPFTIQINTDPLWSDQWPLKNTGQKGFSQSAGNQNQDINILAAYQSGFSGKNIVVGISDTAFEVNHEDLEQNALSAPHRDYINGKPENGFQGTPLLTNDTHGYHGTGVAGIIGAVGWNNVGIRGVAPEVRIASLNFIDSDQSLNKLIDQITGPFDIINQSWGTSNVFPESIEPEYFNALKLAVKNQRSGYGTVIVKAAGNGYNLCDSGTFCSENANQDQYNNNPYTIVVGALNAKGTKASYSAIGSSLWISAPGGEFGSSSPAILTTDISSCSNGLSVSTSKINDFDKGQLNLNSSCNYTSSFNGTSSAAPFVSGAIALLLESNPYLTWRDIKYILAKSARKIDSNSAPLTYTNSLQTIEFSLGWITNSANFSFHNHYGFGALDVEAALKLAKNHVPLPPAQEFLMGILSQINSPFGTNSIKSVDKKMNVTLNKVIESIEIDAEISHSYFGDVVIEIISPAGTRSIVLTPFNTYEGAKDINGNLATSTAKFKMNSNAFYGESSAGEWTIRIKDQIEEDQGQILSLKLTGFGY